LRIRNSQTDNRANSDESPPSEAALYSLLIQGKPIAPIINPERRARAAREELERLARFSRRHAEQLRKLESADARARHDREILEWAARISTRAAGELRALERREADEREAWHRAEQFYERYCSPLSEWSEVDHPREPAGTPEGGQFASKGGSAGSIPSGPGGGSASPTPYPETKMHLPADHRGTWVSGTKGHGTFRYNNALENQKAGLVGKEIRYENGYIAVGGFPRESYYGNDAGRAAVEIDTVKATRKDGLAADALMREKLGDPTWERPEGYRWNHAGGPESKTVELMDEQTHSSVAHKGPGAGPRAQNRQRRGGGGATSRAVSALTVYMTARDIGQTTGLLQSDYEVGDRTNYHFRDEDGNVFIVHEGGIISSPKRVYVDGPRKGETEKITTEEAEQLRKRAEEEFGKYIPGTIFREPRFIPGKKRTSVPLITHPNGIPHEAGWIDDEGVHYHPIPKEIAT
jgi:hypothetical protein